MDNNNNNKLVQLDNNNNNTENDQDILATFRKIVASAQLIGGITNYNQLKTQQQCQINYLEDFKGNQNEEIQKNENYSFKQCNMHICRR